jgi:hypothetical protein
MAVILGSNPVPLVRRGDPEIPLRTLVCSCPNVAILPEPAQDDGLGVDGSKNRITRPLTTRSQCHALGAVHAAF